MNTVGLDDVVGTSSNFYSHPSSGSSSQDSLQRISSLDYAQEFSPVEGNGFPMVAGSLEDMSFGSRAADFWPDGPLSTVAEVPYPPPAVSPYLPHGLDFATLGNNGDFFPSDLPLVSPQIGSFPQPVSHSDESLYNPGLTNGSSGNQSDAELENFWKDNVALRNDTGDCFSSAVANDFIDGPDMAPSTTRSTESTNTSRHLSDSSATTAFHIGSLGTEPDDQDYAIVIPSADTPNNWAWQQDIAADANSISKEYAWLMDS